MGREGAGWRSRKAGGRATVGAGLAPARVDVARRAGGRGAFEDTLALLARTTAWATLCTLVPDLVVGLLLVAGIIDPEGWMRGVTTPSATLALVWVHLAAYLVAFLVSNPAVVRVAHGVGGRRAWAIGGATFVVYQALLYVFIR